MKRSDLSDNDFSVRNFEVKRIDTFAITNIDVSILRDVDRRNLDVCWFELTDVMSASDIFIVSSIRFKDENLVVEEYIEIVQILSRDELRNGTAFKFIVFWKLIQYDRSSGI